MQVPHALQLRKMALGFWLMTDLLAGLLNPVLGMTAPANVM